MNMKTPQELIDELITLAFNEDIGDGDHTTLCCIPATEMGKQKLLIKEAGVLAGVEMARRVINYFDPELKITSYIEDGAEVQPGDVAFVVEGRVQSLLQVERTMLNIMQRMSGIATTTRKYVRLLEGTGTRVLDTRKTTDLDDVVKLDTTFDYIYNETTTAMTISTLMEKIAELETRIAILENPVSPEPEPEEPTE